MFRKIEVPRRRLADQVYDQVVQAINDGLIGPQDRIVQEKLAEQLQVSRTPVREALLRLEQEGALISSDRGGFSIPVATDREVNELYHARQAIEGHCAAMLALSASSAELDSIKTVIRRAEAGCYLTARAYYDANRDIHRSFVSATRNQFLLEMFDLIWNRGLSFGTFRLMNPETMRSTLQGHELLLKAVESRDSLQASQAMKTHIAEGMKLQLSASSRAFAGT